MDFFRHLPIKQKMSLAVLGTTAIALLAACATFVAYERITFRQAMARNLTVLADALARNSVAALSFSKIQDTKDDAAAVLLALSADPAVRAACLYTDEGALHATYAPGGASTKFPASPERIGVRYENEYMVVVRPVKKEEERVGTIYLRADLEGLNARLRLYAGISGLVLLGSLTIALAMSLGLQRLLLRPILALTETARRIGQTRDYSARAERLSGDELGVLTDAFNQMLGDIEERTGALQRANETLRVQATEITDAAAVLALSAGQIVAAMQQLGSSATEAATAVSQTTTTVEEVRQTAQMSSDRAEIVSSQAQKASGVAQDGKHSVAQTIEGMQAIRTQMSSIAESIVNLSTQSHAIAEIIASVDDLAAQSKLLAVNAAIEAAKAGEAGKGFSVVAQEVKLLADQSKQATTQVRGILSDIQKATSDAVYATERGNKAVEAGVEQSTSTGRSIAALAESIDGAAQAAVQIAATSRQQFAGMQQVASAMESISASSAQTVASTRQVESAARQLHALGEKLKQLVGRLKV